MNKTEPGAWKQGTDCQLPEEKGKGRMMKRRERN